jgi:hypothetical protein
MTAYPARPFASVYARAILISAAFSLWAIVPAFCQTPYETQLYRPPSSTLEPNYGVPSFGLPGSELPKQRTMATQRSASTEPDFLSSLGAPSKTDDDADDFKRPTKLRTAGETPDTTTPDTTDGGGNERQAAPN